MFGRLDVPSVFLTQAIFNLLWVYWDIPHCKTRKICIWFFEIVSHCIGCLCILLMVSFVVQKFFSLMKSHLFVYFCFCFLCFCCHIQKKIITRTNVKKLTAYVFFQEFYGFRSYVQVFNQFSVHFYVWCKIVVQFHYFACGCLVFPTPFI